MYTFVTGLLTGLAGSSSSPEPESSEELFLTGLVTFLLTVFVSCFFLEDVTITGGCSSELSLLSSDEPSSSTGLDLTAAAVDGGLAYIRNANKSTLNEQFKKHTR